MFSVIWRINNTLYLFYYFSIWNNLLSYILILRSGIYHFLNFAPLRLCVVFLFYLSQSTRELWNSIIKADNFWEWFHKNRCGVPQDLLKKWIAVIGRYSVPICYSCLSNSKRRYCGTQYLVWILLIPVLQI